MTRGFSCSQLFAACVAAALVSLSFSTANAAEHQVRIVTDYNTLRMAFEPRVLTIAVGDTVVWVNEVDEEHNVMSYPGGFPKGATGLDSPYLQNAGEEFRHEFTVAGTYQYHCLPHLMMGMRGEIIVERPSTPDEFHQPSSAEIKAYQSELLEWFDEDDNLFQVRVQDKSGTRSDHAQD